MFVSFKLWVRAAGLALGLILCPVLGLAAVEANQASAADLVAIKGIGPSTSQKIIEARQQQPFRDWNDFVLRVKGVGPATASKMSAHGLTVNGQRYEATPQDTPKLWQPVVPRPLEPVR
jgi:competence protein ComEA